MDSMTTDRIGQHEVLLSINHKYYTFRGSWKGNQKLVNSGNYALFYDSGKTFGYRDLVVVAMVMILKSATGSFKMQI